MILYFLGAQCLLRKMIDMILNLFQPAYSISSLCVKGIMLFCEQHSGFLH